MSDFSVVLEEIRAMRASFDARFLAHEATSSDRMDRFEDRIIESLREGAGRMKGHSDRLRAIESESDTHVALPPVPAAADPSQPPKRMAWWLVLLVGGAMTVAGSQLWQFLVDSLHAIGHPKP